MKSYKYLLLFVIVLLSFTSIYFYKKTIPNNNRWYTQEQVILGKKIFAQNCSSCHGFNAEKTIVWKKMLADGSYPPPPLNDKAHAWHHTYQQMSRIINDGGAYYGGNMPGFKTTLSQKEIDKTISYFQSFWSDEIYKTWVNNGALKNNK